jgi:hypothetical protein
LTFPSSSVQKKSFEADLARKINAMHQLTALKNIPNAAQVIISFIATNFVEYNSITTHLIKTRNTKIIGARISSTISAC